MKLKALSGFFILSGALLLTSDFAKASAFDPPFGCNSPGSVVIVYENGQKWTRVYDGCGSLVWEERVLVRQTRED